MTKKQEQNASFMVRFQQRIFEENDESKVQWRGKVTHVQDGDEKRFSDFNDALIFIQESILGKSLSMWITIKDVGPKVLRDTIKDPKKQFEHFQDQLQDQINNLGEELSEKVQVDQWRAASRSDFNKIQNQIERLSADIKKLSTKMDAINKK